MSVTYRLFMIGFTICWALCVFELMKDGYGVLVIVGVIIFVMVIFSIEYYRYQKLEEDESGRGGK